MKYLMLATLLASLSCAYAGKANVNPVEDDRLNYFLNNVSLLLETSDPDEFPGVLRLVQIPDESDNCSWIANVVNITSAVAEDGCPQKKLYLTLSNWDTDPDQYSFFIGSSINWRYVSTTVDYRKSQSDWKATILLESEGLDGESVVKKNVSIKIINKYESYTVELIENKAS